MRKEEYERNIKERGVTSHITFKDITYEVFAIDHSFNEIQDKYNILHIDTLANKVVVGDDKKNFTYHCISIKEVRFCDLCGKDVPSTLFYRNMLTTQQYCSSCFYKHKCVEETTHDTDGYHLDNYEKISGIDNYDCYVEKILKISKEEK